jgi:hypothetical protein
MLVVLRSLLQAWIRAPAKPARPTGCRSNRVVDAARTSVSTEGSIDLQITTKQFSRLLGAAEISRQPCPRDRPDGLRTRDGRRDFGGPAFENRERQRDAGVEFICMLSAIVRYRYRYGRSQLPKRSRAMLRFLMLQRGPARRNPLSTSSIGANSEAQATV